MQVEPKNHRAPDELHHYEYSDAQIATTFREQLHREIIATLAFRRLKSIRFLGAIDYILPQGAKRPQKRHSRYEHSLAVASLAHRYCESAQLDERSRNYCVAAALLHDIGHAPLSHSLEAGFKSQFELDHHKSGEQIIRGEVKLGVGLSQVLANSGLNNFRIMSIIAGKDEAQFNRIFAHSINIDTIEAILRSSTYLYRSELMPSAVLVLDSLISLGPKSEVVLDAFWNLKHEVYTRLIQGNMGLMADYLCKRYMEVNAMTFKESYYFGTETELKRDHSELFEVLQAFGRTKRFPDYLVGDGHEMHVVRRSFVIDTGARLADASMIDRRYLQRKRKVILRVRKTRGGYELSSDAEHQRGSELF